MYRNGLANLRKNLAKSSYKTIHIWYNYLISLSNLLVTNQKPLIEMFWKTFCWCLPFAWLAKNNFYFK
jgi:hypothetical protein